MIENTCLISAQNVLSLVREYELCRQEAEQDSLKAIRMDWSNVEAKREAIRDSNFSDRMLRQARERLQLMNQFSGLAWKTVMDLKRIADRLHIFYVPEKVMDWDELKQERERADSILRFLMQDNSLYRWMDCWFEHDEDDIPF